VRKYLIPLLFAILTTIACAQDSVDVTFRYRPTTTSPGMVYLPGEFNNWASNVNGVIPPNSPSAMSWDPLGKVWTKTVRLRIGFFKTIVGAYQYKINEDGSNWFADPLNPRTNVIDNGNSYLYVGDPTIYQLIPNQLTGFVKTSAPVISAYLFPKVGGVVDTSALSITVDSRSYSGIGRSYDPAGRKLSFTLPDRLPNGPHSIRLRIGSVSDSVTIVVQAGSVQITNIGNFTTRNPLRWIYGVVDDTSIHKVQIVRNDNDTVVVSVANGKYSFPATLKEGANTFKGVIRDSSNNPLVSDPVTYTYFVNHAPIGAISFLSTGSQIVLSGMSSSDPDTGQTSRLTFEWKEVPGNPETSWNGATQSQPSVTIPEPRTPGDYAFSLIVTDPDGNKDTTRNYFSILDDGSFQNSTLASNPRWVRGGRVYELFFKSLRPQGTINAALPYLPYFKNLGVNILWVMPVMVNAAPMDNGSGTGYNIKDFFNVAPEYGTNDDFRNFVSAAHRLGLKVILDVTPNHTSYVHPFVVQGRQFHENSPYWTFYQHTIIPHNDNGVGPQVFDSDGYVYYSAFSSQLLNYNWADIDARTSMIEVYKWWINQFDIDGYRFDVYWGPRRRANNGGGGENEMGDPVRAALKHVKADILLLAEDDGTGVGTEVIFGDQGGGVDAGYDWQLYGNAIKPFYSKGIDILNNYITNFGGDKMGYVPGPNAFFMRFLENHDEDRIVSLYGSYERSMPVGTVVMTVPGLPMIYSGQEVGFGLGLGTLDLRRRGVIDWNAPGKALLTPHYQRLANIRALYPAFDTQAMVRVPTGNSSLYAFTRPYPKANGVTVVNVSSSKQDFTLYLDRTNLDTSACQCGDHFGNDLYNDTTVVLPYVNGQLVLRYSLKPFGSGVFVVSDSVKRLVLPSLVTAVDEHESSVSQASGYQLHQNYPNPFNPSTAIRFDLPSESNVTLKVFNILGAEVATLMQGRQGAGTHTMRWNGIGDGGTVCSSGVYFVRIEAGGFVDVKRMILIR
jgi:glycosidase